MALIKILEKDKDGNTVSERYINKDQIVTITVEKDATNAAVVMSNGDCLVVPKEIVDQL